MVTFCIVHRVVHNIRGYGGSFISEVMFRTWVVYRSLAALVIICTEVRSFCIRPTFAHG